MNTLTNRSMILSSRPVGFPKESDFQLLESACPTPREGELLIKTLYLSVDSYMRGRMNAQESYAPSFKLNQPMVGRAVGQVAESKNSQFATGTFVFGFMPMQEYSLSDGQGLRLIDPDLAPLEANLSVFGSTGLTAYFGLMDIGKPQPGETVLVSGAAGAVGSMVGQIAKIQGCRVVGTAGSESKVQHLLKDLKFDAAINYKTANLQQALSEACSQGIDVYIDNVGGEVTDCALGLINSKARIVLCGQISQYNAESREMGPRNLFHLIAKVP